jgi:dolichol-phosphate mannosyltransferase
MSDGKDSPAFPASPLVSIVVPTYHEADNIEALCTRIAQSMNSAELAYELVFVDDNSNDGSVEIVARLAEAGQPVRMIVRCDQRGLATAVLDGFRAARGEILVCMDADLSHPPEAIPRLVETIRNGEADFVLGSRYTPGGTTDEEWGLARWVNSKVATCLARPFTRAKDPMSGFFALPRSLFEQAGPLDPIGYKIALELLVKCPCRKVAEVPIHFAKRFKGSSKLNVGEQLRYLKHLTRLARYRLGRGSATRPTAKSA